MKSIEIIRKKLDEISKDKLTNVLSTVGVAIPYAYLIEYLIESIYLIQRPIILLSPILFANYFYNDSKSGNLKISRIRLAIMLICATLLISAFTSWLICLRIINVNSNSYHHVTKLLSIVGMFCMALLLQPNPIKNIIILKPKVSLFLYLLAHFFWVLSLFFMVSHFFTYNEEDIIFTKNNFTIFSILLLIVITYSFIQQYIHKLIKKFIIVKL